MKILDQLRQQLHGVGEYAARWDAGDYVCQIHPRYMLKLRQELIAARGVNIDPSDRVELWGVEIKHNDAVPCGAVNLVYKARD